MYICLSFHPSCMYKNLNTGLYLRTFHPNSFYLNCWELLLTPIIHHQWPWPWLRVTSSAWGKIIWLNFLTLYTFPLVKMKVDVVLNLKQFKLNILILLFSKMLWNQEKWLQFTDCHKTHTHTHTHTYYIMLACIQLFKHWLCSNLLRLSLHFDTGVSDHHLHSRSQKTKLYN